MKTTKSIVAAFGTERCDEWGEFHEEWDQPKHRCDDDVLDPKRERMV